MNGLPPDVDLSFFAGASLIQLCIGENETILNFYPDISIMVASTMKLSSLDGDETLLDDPRGGATLLVPLISDSVVRATGSTDGTLRLEWSSGRVLQVLDTWSDYESYTVKSGEVLLVV